MYACTTAPIVDVLPACYRYGDNVEEMDASLGEILAALHEHKLEDNTIVYFLSDNGGHLEYIDEDGQRSGGHNGLFKGRVTAWLATLKWERMAFEF